MKALKYPFVGSYPITQKFGENPQVYARFGLDGHNGVDFGLPVGTPVLACADGVIEQVKMDAQGYGLHIRHRLDSAFGRYLVIYAHLSQTLVKPGDWVMSGHQIALSGNTGFSTGPHLHFEVRLDNKAVDPLPLLETSAEDAQSEKLQPGFARVSAEAGLVIRLSGQRDGDNRRGLLKYGDTVEVVREANENGYVGIVLYVSEKYLTK
jgi:murein DD-endopeptidase MepM/ murein hydrolase activator NlpD